MQFWRVQLGVELAPHFEWCLGAGTEKQSEMLIEREADCKRKGLLMHLGPLVIDALIERLQKTGLSTAALPSFLHRRSLSLARHRHYHWLVM